MNAWVHGEWTFRGTVVEVRETFHLAKGRPKRSAGWVARIVFGGIEIVTTEHGASRNDCQTRLMDDLNKLFEQS